jgi:ribosomal protein L22
MSDDPKKDEVEETVAGKTPVDETSAEASADEVGRGDERSEAGVAETTTEETAAEETSVEEAPVEETAADEASVEEAPVEETAAEEASVEDEAPAVEPVAEEKSKRTRRQKAEEPAAEEAEPVSTPERRRDRRAPAPAGLTVGAQAKYVRTSARKARLVCDHIRGKDVVEARAILAFTPRRAAEAWIKLLESAVANAEHNHELVGEDLKILSVHADEGPTLKRFRPRAMGRATRIRKRTSHLTITLTPKES